MDFSELCKLWKKEREQFMYPLLQCISDVVCQFSHCYKTHARSASVLYVPVGRSEIMQIIVQTCVLCIARRCSQFALVSCAEPWNSRILSTNKQEACSLVIDSLLLS
jgi:hypothetical protein